MPNVPLTPDQRSVRVAAGQHAILTNDDALRCGLTQDQIDHRVAVGRWIRVTRGAYAMAGSPRTWRQDAMAACLAAHAAAASHLTAAALHGLARSSPLPHITVPARASGRARIARVHRSILAPEDRCWVDGIPCTSVPRTLADCAALVERARLETMIDDSLCGGLASIESVLASLTRSPGRQGGPLLKALLEVWAEDIRPGSPAEVRFLRRLEDWGATGAVTQHEVFDRQGRFVARLDVALPDRRHGFEYDSDRWHNPRHWALDEPRHAQLQALGWRLDHVSKRDLLPSADRIPALLARHAA